MLCYLFQRKTAGFSFIVVTCILCHTVAVETKPSDSNLDKSLILSLVKRETIRSENEEKLNQTQIPILSDDKTTSTASISNQTFPQVKPSVANGNFNITQSLPPWIATIKSGALERTGFVILGFMLIIIVFFIVRGIRLRHKRSKSRKYGIITSTDMEMEPLDKDDDEEEDTTLFDAQHKYTLP